MPVLRNSPSVVNNLRARRHVVCGIKQFSLFYCGEDPQRYVHLCILRNKAKREATSTTLWLSNTFTTPLYTYDSPRSIDISYLYMYKSTVGPATLQARSLAHASHTCVYNTGRASTWTRSRARGETARVRARLRG